MSVLLITEHPLTQTDLDDLDELATTEPGERAYFVAVPLHHGAESLEALLDNSEYLALGGRGTEVAVDHPDVQHSPALAEERDAELILAAVLRTLRDAGHPAQGQVTEHNPLHTVHELLAEHPCDEVVVLIRHPGLVGVFHHDLAGRLAKDLDIPVLRVKSHRD